MTVVKHKNIPLSKCHSPRVDSKSLVLKNSDIEGEAQVGAINDLGVNDDEVLLWNNYSKRLKSTGVKDLQLQTIRNATVGKAKFNTVLVLDAHGDLNDDEEVFRIHDLGIGNDLFVYNNLIVYNDVEINNDLYVKGDFRLDKNVETHLVLGSLKELKSSYLGVGRDIVKRANFLGTPQPFISIGNSLDELELKSSTDDLRLNVGAVTKRIWHLGQQGSGTGMDSDMLDGAHLTDILKSYNVVGSPNPLEINDGLDHLIGGMSVIAGKYIFIYSGEMYFVGVGPNEIKFYIKKGSDIIPESERIFYYDGTHKFRYGISYFLIDTCIETKYYSFHCMGLAGASSISAYNLAMNLIKVG